MTAPGPGDTAAEALVARLVQNRRIEGDCWIWTGHLNPDGYGKLYHRGRTHYVHRLAYEAFIGPYPDWATQTDHLCRNKSCFNPEHLEAVTARTNMLRGMAPTALAVRTGVCLRGHALTPENVYVQPSGKRNCRKCSRIRGRRHQARAEERRRERKRTDPEYAARRRAVQAAVSRRQRARKKAQQ